ncbi:MAG: anthranilate synthase component I family protein [Saccharospirillaceae bacterium]|nr:anthranilate synthase component I family protein [Pseudomonadales bacterium]NRB79937.1 anthranilate synthase component I family protein [Saccharospirillaceae bacterium]
MSLIELPYQADISQRFAHFKHLEWSMLFDSCQQERFDWFSSLPSKTVTLKSINVITQKSYSKEQNLLETTTINEDIFTYLNKFEFDDTHPQNLPFTGGWLGYLSYDLAQAELNDKQPNNKDSFNTTLEQLGLNDLAQADIIDKQPNKNHSFNTPLAQLGLYDWACINDHKLKKSYLWFNCSDSKQLKIEHILSAELKLPELKSNEHNTFNFDWKNLTTKTNYINNVESILAYILEGDCYQTNYTQCWESKIPDLDSFVLYQSRKQKCPTPFSGYIVTPELVLASHSPEAFISIKDNQIDTYPIKGTTPRSDDPIEDALLKTKLACSAKDRAENIMITDLLRNDLSKTAIAGSVKCPEICKVYSYSNVHHLVSHVSATLNSAKYSIVDVLKHAFPGGSITGAPKKRAMQIIDELEDQSRSLYCGSMFALSCNKQLHSNILIRSFIYFEQTLRCYAGGGIVMDSDPQSEYQESLSKVSILKD